ncbi:MAG TPA: Mur ligase domain-containing protein [Candidatus Saccharimonadales bacterium]|nr:Mur ligase domain-containing protein [Candidatus Saccharimonadales bacterium]
MHVFFSGIGGAGIGPLALIAKQAGYHVSGSDKQSSHYIDYLKSHGIDDITIGQTTEQIAAVHERQPIDWFIYTSAITKERPDHPELEFCKTHDIKATKRDEFINQILKDKKLKLVAVAGTHGKTTTTAMAVWLFKQLGMSVSYSVGAKISFGQMGEYVEGSDYFVYEADEYDRNFLAFRPEVAIITGIDWDHPDIYPTREEYHRAFEQFVDQSKHVIFWRSDFAKLNLNHRDNFLIIDDEAKDMDKLILPGLVNRKDAWQVIKAMQLINESSVNELTDYMNIFPGLSRRFEQIVPNLISDYAHTPEKIRGALQTAHEVASGNVVVVYEGLHNTRQHFIKEDLKHLFDDVKHLYVVPSYLAREDPKLHLLSPKDIIKLTAHPDDANPAELNDELKKTIKKHLDKDDLVLCLTAGGGGSLDEWLRKEFLTTN